MPSWQSSTELLRDYVFLLCLPLHSPAFKVFNNLEFDHADIFRDLADVQRTFIHFSRIIPRNGYALLNGDDSNLRALGAMPWTRVIRVGADEGNDTRIVDFE